MAKRYSDTDKWKKPFIKSLPAEYKLLWIYLLDECDHAGIWNVEWDTLELRLGIKLSQEKAARLFGERVVSFDNGTKWFVPDFIEFQYGILNPDNKVHGSVIDKLKKYKIEGHARGLEASKDKAKEKDLSNNTLSNIQAGENKILLAEISKLSEAYMLPQNQITFDQLESSLYLKPGELVLWLDKFSSNQISEGTTVKTLDDFKSHFARWLRKQDYKNPPANPNTRKQVF